MKLNILLLCCLIGPCLALTSSHQVTVCPEDYPTHHDCHTLDQLLSDPNLIKSDTTISFVSATFQLKSDLDVSIVNVSNITLDTAGALRANLSCVGENSGFLFQNVSGLTIRNLNFIHCGVVRNLTDSGYNSIFTVVVIESSDIVLDNITFKHGKDFGIYFFNVYGNISILNALFAYMEGTSISITYEQNSSYSHSSSPHSSSFDPAIITISNSNFDSNYYVQGSLASVLELLLFDPIYPVSISITDVRVTNTTYNADNSDIFIWTFSSLLSRIVLERYHTSNNTVVSSSYSDALGSSNFFYLYDSESSSDTTIIEIRDSSFVNNVFGEDDRNTDDLFDITENLYSVLLFFINYGFKSHTVTILNTTISDNTGEYGHAVYFENVGVDDEGLTCEIINSTITNNTIFSSDYYKKGAVYMKGVSNITIQNSSFLNNAGTGLLVERSNVYFSGHNVIKGNAAYNGGGMGLYKGSNIILRSNATLSFENNYALNFGGGLYVEKPALVHFKIEDNLCFLQAGEGVTLEFNNNSAKTAGNDLYGGDLYTCGNAVVPGWQVLTDIVHSPDNYTVEVVSEPLRVCDCSKEDSQSCINIDQIIQTVQTYPGKAFNLSIIAVGQLLNATVLSGVPSAVHASLLSQNSTNSSSIHSSMLVQNCVRTCSTLTYRVNSVNQNETMILAVSGDGNKIPHYFASLWRDHLLWPDHVSQVMLHDLPVPAYVSIQFLPCPLGFERSSHGMCVCSAYVKEYVINCSIDTMMMERKPSNWISFKEHVGSDDNSSLSFLAHKHCPSDYCRPGTFDFSIEKPDEQCDNGHSGVLCGGCKKGYSSILGGTVCRQCSNIYLLLLIPFGLAGILLVIFISLTDMTVAGGTINGLLFYASVVANNKASYFTPHTSSGFLSIFLAWLNLDLGIDSCFYEGMDAYAFTWLQLCFPLFVWLLVFGIILACRYFTFMNRLCGSNIVPVLATLFLLSYTKLQNAISASLSFTVVEMNGKGTFVWLKDGNVPYLQGKHIALFLVAVVLLLIFSVYTLSIMLGPWLQSKTHYRVFCWVLKMKPLFDAYFGPLKDKCRYWTGVLLFSRMILSLISSVNALGDDSINLLAVITVTIALFTLLSQSGSVYKNWCLSLLDSFFLANLGILTSFTLFNNLSSSGNQNIIVLLSAGTTFLVFCIIVLYHCLRRVAKHKFFASRKEFKALLRGVDVNYASCKVDSDEGMLDAIDAERND